MNAGLGTQHPVKVVNHFEIQHVVAQTLFGVIRLQLLILTLMLPDASYYMLSTDSKNKKSMDRLSTSERVHQTKFQTTVTP